MHQASRIDQACVRIDSPARIFIPQTKHVPGFMSNYFLLIGITPAIGIAGVSVGHIESTCTAIVNMDSGIKIF